MNQKELDDLLTIEGNIHALELAIKALMKNCGFVPAPETIEGLRRTAEKSLDTAWWRTLPFRC